MERQKFFVAMIAPVGTALMGLALGIDQLFVAGLVLTGLLLFAAILRRMSGF
jgi:hypothetical protein